MDTEKNIPEEPTSTPNNSQNDDNDVDAEKESDDNTSKEDAELEESNQDQEITSNNNISENGNNSNGASFQKTDDSLLDNLIYDANQALRMADKTHKFLSKNQQKSKDEQNKNSTAKDSSSTSKEDKDDTEIIPSEFDNGEIPQQPPENDEGEGNAESKDNNLNSSANSDNEKTPNVSDSDAETDFNAENKESNSDGDLTQSDDENNESTPFEPSDDNESDAESADNTSIENDESNAIPKSDADEALNNHSQQNNMEQDGKKNNNDAQNNEKAYAPENSQENRSYDLPWRKNENDKNTQPKKNQFTATQPTNQRENLTTTASNSQIKIGEKAANDVKNIRSNLNRKALQEASETKMVGGASKLLKALKNIKMIGASKFIKVGIIVSILSLALITIIFTYALPSSQYEYAETYTKEYYQEIYETEIYEETDRITLWKKIVTAFKVTAEAITDKIGEKMSQLKAFVNIVKVANVDEDGNEIEEFSDDGRELKTSYVTDIQKRTLKDKIQATQTKVDGRIDNIEEALNKQQNKIENAIEDKYKTSEFDEFIPIVTFNTSYLSEEGGAAIMALYMAQEGGKLDDVRISSLLKWLGYNEERGKVAFSAVNTKCEVEQWEGSFLPQYLHEQELQDENVEKHFRVKKLSGQKYDDNRTAAVDLIIMVDAPELDDLTVDKTVIKNEDGSEKVIGRVNCEINIRPREFKDIADLMGMWIGDLSKRQDYMPSYLNVNMIASGGGFGMIDGNYEWIEGGDLMPWKPYHNLYSNWVGYHGQCTWYAADRLYQLFVETNGEMGIDLKGQPMGNGGQWSATARSMGFHVDHVAAVGKAACFVPGQTRPHPGDDWSVDAFSGSAGHIAIVEKVNPDGSIVVSEFWGSQVDYKVHFSKFSAETAATIDFIDFTRRN